MSGLAIARAHWRIFRWTVWLPLVACLGLLLASCGLEPAPPLGPPAAGSVAVLSVPAHVYRDRSSKSPDEDRFCIAETEVFFGAMTVPNVKRRNGANFDLTATEATPPPTSAIRTLVVRLRGNQELIEQIVRKTDWSQLQALFK